jgi:hypothetical protein
VNIVKLEPHQIFVFGSNTEGRHGGGAARQAMKWGAIYGQASGRQGQTYAVITKRLPVTFLGWDAITLHLQTLFDYAVQNPQLEFLLTPIGTGLAGGELEDLEEVLSLMIIPENVKKCW